MSYYNQGYGGGPPPGGQYPQSNYPHQGGYPPQQPYGYNQGPPPQMNQGYQQNWNQPPPPQQGWGPPPQQGWNQSPYPQQPAPYGHPPQGPPPGGPGGYGPPPGQFGGPGPVAAASMGYVLGQQAPMDMSRQADDLRKAMKGFGTNERALIEILAPLDPLQINGVKQAFYQRHHRHLDQDIHSETSGYFREGLLAIVRGPLDQDCHALHESIKGLGTKESAMNDVLLARTNADLNAIKQRYHQMYHRTLESDVKGDLSMKTERLFDMVLSARRNEESAPVIPQQVDADVQELYRATEARSGADQIAVSQIMTTRSNGQIRAISQAYKHKYHRSLDEVFRKEFSGHMEDAFLFMLRHAEDPAKHDADLLEDSMRGMGTKDQALVRRIVMIHWNKERLHQCKAAYKYFYKRDLRQRIMSETSGDYENLMVACVGPQ